MSYAIAKRAYDGYSASYVTAIRKGGLSIDNARIFDTCLRIDHWKVRKWKTEESADAALEKLARVGGFDDYEIVQLEDY